MAATDEPQAPQINVDVVEVIAVMVDMLRATWPLWVLLASIGLGKLLLAIRQQRRLARSRISEIDLMDGPTFERYLQTLFQQGGYHVEHIGSPRGDYGGDLMVLKNGTRTLVQAKRYSKNVGVPAVQQAVTAKAMYDCTEAMVVTNSGYTQQARKLAHANHVRLMGRDELVRMILATSGDPVMPWAATAASSSFPSMAVAGAACARCGVGVSEKVRDYCLAHGARFAGFVYCYEHQRGFKTRR